jgi:hypothetical protein
VNDRDRFDDFTEQARKVLNLAQEQARRLQHNYIGTEHLLLALVCEGEGGAAKVLANLGVDLNKVRNAVEFIIDHGDRIVLGEIGLTPRAKKVIKFAVDEARRLNHHSIGAEHLLLGLVREGDGIAAGVLESLGVNLRNVRMQTSLVLSQSSTVTEWTIAHSLPLVLLEAAAIVAEKDLANPFVKEEYPEPWLTDTLPWGFPRRSPDVAGTIIRIQQLQELPVYPNLVIRIVNMLIAFICLLPNRMMKKGHERLQVAMRIRTSNDETKDAYLIGDLRGANLALGDVVSLWGWQRQGRFTVRKGYNHTSKRAFHVRTLGCRWKDLCQ